MRDSWCTALRNTGPGYEMILARMKNSEKIQEDSERFNQKNAMVLIK